MQIIKFNSKEQHQTSFLKEYYHLVKEFFSQIPWINSIEDFSSSIYILIDNNILVGGVVVFNEAPEESYVIKFKDENLKESNFFISTLFIKEEYRSQNLGNLLLKHVFEIKRNQYNFAWGVIENNVKLLSHYYKTAHDINLKQIDKDISLITFKLT